MYHVPGYLVAARHPVVLVNGLVAVYLDEIETAVCGEVLIHLRRRHLYRRVLRKTTRSGLDDGICLWQNLRQHMLIDLFDFLLEFIYLVVDFLTLLNRRTFDGRFQFRDAVFTLFDGCL